jgi:diadenosine tetraphosphatase ApaH/serine/threonine PP2A family protein phosphatase
LGDVVGYGPYPSECIDIIRERNIPTVMGNHDAGVAGELSTKHFKDPNRKLITLTQEILNSDQLNWLRNLPYTIMNSEQDWLAVHANPKAPEKWEYVDSAIKARTMLGNIDQKLCFVGHTHIPGVVSDQIGIMDFNKEHKYLINPGSVGQSRDGDFRASCCIIDLSNWKIEILRVAYPIEKVLTGLYKLGFSRAEAHRLLRY